MTTNRLTVSSTLVPFAQPSVLYSAAWKALFTLLVAALLSGCFISNRGSFDGDDGYYSSGGDSGNDMGFGKGDGPPLEQRDVSQIPDATPRWEPKAKSGNPRSYVIQGKRYYVMDSAVGYEAVGMASWYGKKFHGRKTSSGEVYDLYGMTAAHTALPLPTYVRVTRLGNSPYTGRSIIVKVNDRGPFLGNRLIDLSYAAAKKLGIIRAGTAQVKVEAIIVPPNTAYNANDYNGDIGNDRYRPNDSYGYQNNDQMTGMGGTPNPTGIRTYPVETSPVETNPVDTSSINTNPATSYPVEDIQLGEVVAANEINANSSTNTNTSTNPNASGNNETIIRNGASGSRPLSEPVAVANTSGLSTGYYAQVGAFQNRDTALRLQNNLTTEQSFNAAVEPSQVLTRSSEQPTTLYRVLIGPYNSIQTTEQAMQRLAQLGYRNAIIVER